MSKVYEIEEPLLFNIEVAPDVNKAIFKKLFREVSRYMATQTTEDQDYVKPIAAMKTLERFIKDEQSGPDKKSAENIVNLSAKTTDQIFQYWLGKNFVALAKNHSDLVDEQVLTQWCTDAWNSALDAEESFQEMHALECEEASSYPAILKAFVESCPHRVPARLFRAAAIVATGSDKNYKSQNARVLAYKFFIQAVSAHDDFKVQVSKDTAKKIQKDSNGTGLLAEHARIAASLTANFSSEAKPQPASPVAAVAPKAIQPV